MSHTNSWSSLNIRIDPFGSLKKPLHSALGILESIEKILEALLALVKAFMLDLMNPIRALISLLLAAIRAIINQIKSTGFSMLLIRPDFRQSDLRAVFNSVSGGYRAFESKLIGKFYDESDPFRPQYSPGMNAMMIVLYVGAESPGDLMSEIMAMLDLIKHPMDDLGLAAPVSLTVSTPTQSGDPVSQFWHLFEPTPAGNSLVLEWKMPTSASGMGSPTLVGQIASSLPSYNLGQKFLIERTDDDKPAGQPVLVKLDSKTQGERVENTIRRFNVPSVSTKVAVKERSGGRYKFFKTRMKADDFTYMGGATGTYRFIDTQLEPGKAYNYRVRAYMGNLSGQYVDKSIDTPEKAAKHLTKYDAKDGWVVNFGNHVTVGRPSATIRGYVPMKTSTGAIFDMYKDTMNAIVAALLLNFELPFPSPTDSKSIMDKKTGWGTLSILAGPIGWMKVEKPTAKEFVEYTFLKPAVRRIVNPVLEKLVKQPHMASRLSKMWSAGVKETVETVLKQVGYSFGGTNSDPPVVHNWKLFGVRGDVTDSVLKSVNDYLEKSDPNYASMPNSYLGPIPLSGNAPGIGIDVQQRRDLAEFLQTVLSISDQSASYLQWYSVTVGDLFPTIVPYLYDFEQWILALLKALNSALQEISDIIETLLQRVRDLEQLLRAMIALIEMLNIELSVSMLSVSGNGGVESLVDGLLGSSDKPGDQPYGLHSGYVFAAGGPGPGFTKALEALKFIITCGSA